MRGLQKPTGETEREGIVVTGSGEQRSPAPVVAKITVPAAVVGDWSSEETGDEGDAGTKEAAVMYGVRDAATAAAVAGETVRLVFVISDGSGLVNPIVGPFIMTIVFALPYA